jgi:hypothetical protein
MMSGYRSTGLVGSLGRVRWWLAVGGVVFGGLLLVCVSSAGARGVSAVWWGLSSGSRPTILKHGGIGEIVLTAQNLGDVATTGPVVVKDQLPGGLEVLGMVGFAGGTGNDERGPVRCLPANLECKYGSHEVTKEVAGKQVKEVVQDSLRPYESIEIRIQVAVKNTAKAGEINQAEVSGGSAAQTAVASNALKIGASGASFGIEEYKFVPENEDGLVDSQAGSHPFQNTSTVTFNNEGLDSGGQPAAVGLLRGVIAELPAGFIGNPTPFAQCSDKQFATQPEGELAVIVNECPAASALGVANVKFKAPNFRYLTSTVPIFNVTPRPGEPARFGFKAAGVVSVFLDASIRTGGDYGVSIASENIAEEASVLSVRLTFWGVPGDPRHDPSRGWECMYQFGTCATSTETNPPPFLVMPSSCEQPFVSTLKADAWAAEGKPAAHAVPVSYELPEKVDGCVHLPFEPEIRVSPDVHSTSTSTGLNVDVHVPQDSVLNSESLAESNVKDITVALPKGVAVNPSGGDGLQACNEGLAGFTGFSPGGSPVATFTPALPDPLQQGVNFCPDASKIGTVRIATPLLPKGQDLTGAVYLASQNQNPFGSLVAMYLIAKDPVSGAVVKLPGEVRLSETGQIVTTFKNNPQLAFEDAELHFFGGERAPLTTPAHCGSYTTNAIFAPWSGNEPVNANSTFDITSGPHGGPCPSPSLPFDPSLTGGTTNINAGSFTPLTTTIGREDGQQNMQAVQLHMPPGVSGLLTGVALCPETQANEGTCGPDSQIGETTVSAGVGSDPVSVKGGRVYLTGPYQGAPFGLSIVNPVKAGPFDLEHDTSNPNQNPACDCVVVRAKIQVDPHTAALTVTTDPSGAHAIPHLIDGIPVQIQKVNVLINRPGFTFNPTNCNPSAITGTISSDEGSSSPVSVPFQATNCAILAFAPKFSVSTSAHTSKANGASLTVKLSQPGAPFGTQANPARVKVELPKQLPSRLTTLQKACTAAQFDTNPAGCPAASVIGHATVHTPLLPVPLEGPAYFVSNGGEAFPNLIMVLQGYGVTVQLVGDTFISKQGITSSTFKTVPDVPFNTFELTLPQGPHSALTANTSLCASKLVMPTEFLAQNGALIRKNTPITTTGCPKKKTLTRRQKLALALKACHKKKGHKRIACERAARKKYGPVKKSSKKK